MSPEQAKGRAVDKRSDVWAFGAVLYEMLTARRAFEGEDVSDTLARILMKEPDWTALPATVPAAVVTVIRRCLQKDRKQRVRDMSATSRWRWRALLTRRAPPSRSPRPPRYQCRARVGQSCSRGPSARSSSAGWRRPASCGASADLFRRPSSASSSPLPPTRRRRSSAWTQAPSRCRATVRTWSIEARHPPRRPRLRTDGSICASADSWSRRSFGARKAPSRRSSPRTASGSRSGAASTAP